MWFYAKQTEVNNASKMKWNKTTTKKCSPQTPLSNFSLFAYLSIGSREIKIFNALFIFIFCLCFLIVFLYVFSYFLFLYISRLFCYYFYFFGFLAPHPPFSEQLQKSALFMVLKLPSIPWPSADLSFSAEKAKVKINILQHRCQWVVAHSLTLAHYARWRVGHQRTWSFHFCRSLAMTEKLLQVFPSVAFLSPPSAAKWSSDDPSFAFPLESSARQSWRWRPLGGWHGQSTYSSSASSLGW